MTSPYHGCHLTGRYPSWWQGKRFEGATDGWACGTNSQTTRDVVQGVLLGKSAGQGMIPTEAIAHMVAGRGITGSIETVWVQHVSGKNSKLGFKTYEQGRRAFEGEAKDFVWCDEEPPMDIYTEILYRLLTTKGLAWTTFTPLLGMSEVVMSFLSQKTTHRGSRSTSCRLVGRTYPTWTKKRSGGWSSTRRPIRSERARRGRRHWEREPSTRSTKRRSRCPIARSRIRGRGPSAWMWGWNRTAVVWGAQDPGSGIIYLYSEHYQGMGEPASHAQAIRARGMWVPGVIDPACLGSSQIDGRTLMDLYRELGLDLRPAVNAVEAGITEAWNLLISGRLKVMASLTNWFREFRRYHRDDKASGKIVKRDDHLMDATRYLIVSGRLQMQLPPEPEPPPRFEYYRGPDAWMQ